MSFKGDLWQWESSFASLLGELNPSVRLQMLAFPACVCCLQQASVGSSKIAGNMQMLVHHRVQGCNAGREFGV